MSQLSSGRGRISRVLGNRGRVRSMSDDRAMEQLEARTLMDAVFWDGGAGTNNWHDAANWNRNGVDAVPLNGDDVTINVAANPTVAFSTGTLTLNSLTTNENLTISGGTLGVTGTADINATLLANGGTLSGGTWDFGGGTLRAGTSTTALTNMNILGDITLDTANTQIRVNGTTRFNTARLSASSVELQFAPNYTLHDDVIGDGADSGSRTVRGATGGGGTLTIAPTGSIVLAAGAGGNLNLLNSSATAIINNGLISIEAANRTLLISTTSLTNNATLQALAGTLTNSPNSWTNPGAIIATDAVLNLQGDWSNSGTITINHTTVNLGGTFSTTGLALNRTGGVVNITGAAMNAGNTLSFNASTGSWRLSNGSINGGTVNPGSGANRLEFTSTGGTLTDVQVNGDLTLDVSSANVRIGGTTRFGAAHLTASSAEIGFIPGYVLQDDVVASGAATGGRVVRGAIGGSGTLTIAPTGSIVLAAGSGGNLSILNSSAASIINDGLISSEATGRNLLVSTTSMTNNATIRAIGGSLDLQSVTWTNAGQITGADGTISFAGAWSSTGSITVTGTTVNLGGTFVTGFSLTRTAGTINVTGVADNTGRTLTFNAVSGPWRMVGGTINGGTINIGSGENRLTFTPNNGVLANVQVNGDIVLDTNSAAIRVSGTTRFNAARLSASSAEFDAAPGYVLHDLIIAEGAATGSRIIRGAVSGSGDFTIAPTGVIRLAADSGGNLSILNSSVANIVNNGLISAEAAIRTLQINTTNMTNNGVIQVLAGTADVQPTTWSNPGDITVTGGTLTFGGSWSSTGDIISNNGTVNLGGTFSTAGLTISRTGGTVNLTGTANNVGNTLTFNATTGSWRMANGTINAGAIVQGGANRLEFTSSVGTLTDVQVNGDLVLDATNAAVRIGGTTRFTTGRIVAPGAEFNFAPNYVLHDAVVAEGVGAGQRIIRAAYGGTGTLTISPTGSIRLAAGTGGGLSLLNSSTATVLNQGVISNESANTMSIDFSSFTNEGTVQTSAGIFHIRPTTLTNYAKGTLTGGAWIASGTGVMNMAAATVITTNNAAVSVAGPASFPSITTLSVNNGSFTTTGGTFTVTPAGGTLVNNGTVVLKPVSVLNVAGNFTQSEEATLTTQIQGETPSDIGRLTISGTGTLAGHVNVVAVNGYEASCVNVVYITAGSLIGEFDSQTLPTVTGDHQSLLIYIGGEARFAVSPPSDYNQDGVLNSQDLFDFLTAFFDDDADFNGDGTTNSQDFFDFLADFFEGCD